MCRGFGGLVMSGGRGEARARLGRVMVTEIVGVGLPGGSRIWVRGSQRVTTSSQWLLAKGDGANSSSDAAATGWAVGGLAPHPWCHPG